MSSSEAESQFGEVEEEMQSTEQQQEGLSEWSNAGTTVTGAVVSTVHLGGSRGSADARAGKGNTALTSVGLAPCRYGGGQAATCENVESIAGYDGAQPWTSMSEEYPAGRLVADPPATNGAQRGAIISTFGQQGKSSWCSREVLRVDDVTFQAVQRPYGGDVQTHGEDFGQVVWSRRRTPASASGSCHPLTTGVRSCGDSGAGNVTCPMGAVSEDITCIRVGHNRVIVPVSGVVVHQLNPPGAGEAVQSRTFNGADVHRPWREVGRTSAGVQLTSPGRASAAAALVGLSASHPGRSQEEFQREVVPSHVLSQPTGTGAVEVPHIVTTTGQLSLLDRYQNQIVALQEEMKSLRGQVAAECGYATD